MISVIMCSHDPRAAVLAASIESLRSQTLPASDWEFVLVDNRSATPLHSQVDLAWHSRARTIREESLGLTNARLRGIGETTGSILVFVDDDNILDHDYLERVVEIGTNYPCLGAWGGQSRPRFEGEAPSWISRFHSNLVIRTLERDAWSNIYYLNETLPTGAGLCVRRQTASRYVELHETGQRKILLDRAGKQLLSGGDNDLALCALDLGMGSGTFKSLALTHVIAASRLKEDYLIELAAGIAYSAVILRSFRPDKYPVDPERGFIGAAADSLRSLRRGRRERRLQRAVRAAVKQAHRDLSNREARNQA